MSVARPRKTVPLLLLVIVCILVEVILRFR